MTSGRINVQVQPRARRSEIVGRLGDAIKIRLTAPPVDGAANQALVELLAERLGLRLSQVRVVAGHQSRRKQVEVDGLSPGQIEIRLGLQAER